MKSMLCRITDAQHEWLTRAAAAEGVSAAELIRRMLEQGPVQELVREIHGHIFGKPVVDDLPQAGQDAVAALVSMGEKALDARRRVKAILKDKPALDFAGIVATATRKD